MMLRIFCFMKGIGSFTICKEEIDVSTFERKRRTSCSMSAAGLLPGSNQADVRIHSHRLPTHKFAASYQKD